MDEEVDRHDGPLPDVIGLATVGGFISFAVADAIGVEHPIASFILGFVSIGILVVFITVMVTQHREGNNGSSEDL